MRVKLRPISSGPTVYSVGSCVCAALLAGQAHAQAAPPDQSSASLQEIVVTGTHIASSSGLSDSPLVAIDPSQIAATGQVSLDSALGQMPQFSASQGRAEVGDVQGSTGFTGGQSYSDLRGLGPQRTLVLLDGQRMVPTNPNGAVDLNLIPMALIEAVDVITGGASAAYGSDAMAGVVNFRLRRDVEGIELSYQHGASTHGDGQQNSVSVLMGGHFADHRGSAVLDLEYNERGGITGANRSFFSDIGTFDRGVPRPPEAIFNAGELGGAVPISAVNSILAGYPGTTPLTGTGNYGGYLGLNGNGTLFTTRDPGNCVQNYLGPVNQTPGLHITPDCTTAKAYLGPYFAIQVPLRRYNLFSRVTYDVTDDIQAYGQINFMHSYAQDLQGGAFIGPGKYFNVPLNNPYVTGNAALQSLLAARINPGNGPIQLEDWLTALGPRIESFTYDDYQAAGGVKGSLGVGDLKWNLYASYGQTRFDNAQENVVHTSAIESILYGTANYQGADGKNCVGYAWNPFGSTPISPGCLAYATGTAHNTNTITQKLTDGELTGSLWTLPAGKLKFALGADYRGDSFTYSADPQLNPAFNALPSTYPPGIISPSYDLVSSTAGTQNVREVYAELQIPVLKDMALVKDLSVDLGARHSQYDLSGAANTWKADFHWVSTEAVTLRGSFERAIRAPSLQELYNPIVQAQDSISVDPCEYNSSYRTGPNAAQVAALCHAQGVPASALSSFTYGVASAPGIIQGNPQLQPEVANTYSFGAVFSPAFESTLLRELGGSVDYYHIRISNAIDNAGLDAVLARCFNANGANPNYSASNFYCQQIQRDNNGFISLGREFSLNIGSYTTDGVDFEAHWGVGLSDLGLGDHSGKIRLQSFLSYLNSLTVAGVPGVPTLNFAGGIGDTGTVAAANGTTISDLAHPKWKADTAFNYTVGPVSTTLHWRYLAAMKDLGTTGLPTVPSYSYFDLDGRWQVLDSVDVVAGLTNLFDKTPPYIASAPLRTDAATYDVVGRTYYVGFTAKFK